MRDEFVHQISHNVEAKRGTKSAKKSRKPLATSPLAAPKLHVDKCLNPESWTW